MSEARSIGEAPAVARPRLHRIGRGLSLLSDVSLYIAGIGLVVMTLIVSWQVFTRYVLNWSNAWTEPAAIILMGWFIFLGSAVGVRENFHLGFDVLLYVLPEGSKKTLRTLSDLVVLAFSVGMIVYGMKLVMLSWGAIMPSLGIPEGAKYLPVVVGGVFIALFSLERIALRLAGVDIDRDVNLEDIPRIDAVKEI